MMLSVSAVPYKFQSVSHVYWHILVCEKKIKIVSVYFNLILKFSLTILQISRTFQNATQMYKSELLNLHTFTLSMHLGIYVLCRSLMPPGSIEPNFVSLNDSTQILFYYFSPLGGVLNLCF